jgi:hypothetical protein
MARARKSHDTDKENTKIPRRGLSPAYSAKAGGNQYVIYCSYTRDGDPYPRVLVLSFLATYAARYFVSRLIKDEEYEWHDWMDRDKMIITSSGIKIRAHANQLKEILDYEPTEAEKEWKDEQIIGNINRFKYADHEANFRKISDPNAQEDSAGSDADDGGTNVPVSKRGTRADKPAREKKERKPPVDKGGLVSANDIAKELKVEGREVRGVLRSTGMKKPDVGWAWPKDSAELKAARKSIEDGLKALAKKKAKK